MDIDQLIMLDEMDELYDTLEVDECVDHAYYLGSVFTPNEKTDFKLLLDFRVELPIFFRYPMEVVQQFAHIYPKKYYLTNRLEIIQLQIIDDYYSVVIKTFWIRLLQWKWKRYYKERQLFINSIKKNPMKYIRDIQLSGMYNYK